MASYAVIENADKWSILHDGTSEGQFDTKEAAFESAVAAASLAIRQGHEVLVSAPGNEAGNRTALGAKDNA